MRIDAQPYGGFPWTELPSVRYDSHPNAHSGSTPVADIRATAQRLYRPERFSGAVLADLPGDEPLTW